MAETSNGYPYPILTDPFNVPADIRNLAEATDTGITEVKTRLDAALTIETLQNITMPSGWRARSGMHYRKVGPFIVLGGFFARDTDLSATSYTGAFTLPSAIWPSISVMTTVPARANDGTTNISGTANLMFNTNGSVDFYLPQSTSYIYVHGVLLPRQA